MPGHNEVLAWVEALSAIARTNAERGVDHGGGFAGLLELSMAFYLGAREGERDGALLILDNLTFGLVPGLNNAAEQVRTANAGSMAYTAADWSAAVGTTTLPGVGAFKALGIGAKAAKGAKAAGGAAKAANAAANAVKAGERTAALSGEVRATATILQRDLEHIVARHWPRSAAKAAGKFAPETRLRAFVEMVQKTVANGAARPNTRNRAGTIFEYTFDRVIGTDIAGKATARLRVVVNPSGNVVTAFPY
jgi:hypothetical protein